MSDEDYSRNKLHLVLRVSTSLCEVVFRLYPSPAEHSHASKLAVTINRHHRTMFIIEQPDDVEQQIATELIKCVRELELLSRAELGRYSIEMATLHRSQGGLSLRTVVDGLVTASDGGIKASTYMLELPVPV